jgi:hypothetical protein
MMGCYFSLMKLIIIIAHGQFFNQGINSWDQMELIRPTIPISIKLILLYCYLIFPFFISFTQ